MIDRTYRSDPYEYMSQEPCDYCIWSECEEHGDICPFYKVINRGKCMMCGKELTEGLFFCKECEEKGEKNNEHL